MAAPLSDQVAAAASLLGLLLALATLFTSEQASRLAAERRRSGGANAQRLRSIQILCGALAAVTALAVASLTPLAVDVLGAIGESWEPVLSVFELTYVLLIALVVWQVMLVRQARSTLKKLSQQGTES